METIRMDFNSMADVLEYIGDTPRNLKTGDIFTSHDYSEDHDPGWYGHATWDETIAFARHGWHTGTQQLTEQLAQVEQRVAMEPGSYRYDVHGLFFDVGTVLTGEPECWLEQEETPKRRIFRLRLNPSSGSYTEAHKIVNRGAAMVALADLLQSDPNNIVELEICRINQTKDFGKKGEKYRHEYILHMGTSPIDLDTLAFAIAHPAYNRRLMLAVMERLSGHVYDGTYGTSIADDRQSITTDDDGARTLYLPRATCGKYWDQKARKVKYDPYWDVMKPFETAEGTAKWVTEVARQLMGAE